MALTPSTMLDLGTSAPAFNLEDTQGKTWSLADFEGKKGLLVMFICNHCPYVVHLKEALSAIVKDWQTQGLGVVAINSNDVENYTGDSPERMAEDVQKYGYTFPYLFDPTQEVALSYEAACTPDFFLFDGDMNLVYRGQFDGSRPGNDVPVTGQDLAQAVNALLLGQAQVENQVPSMGCNIKWKAGNEPAYF